MIRIDTIDGTHLWLPENSPITIFQALCGADGKIYLSDGQSSFTFHTVEQPNKLGKACMFRQHNIELPRTNTHPVFGYTYADIWYQGLPNYPHYRLGPEDGSDCDTLGLDNHPLCNWTWDVYDTLHPKQVTFTDNSTYEPTNWYWDFGDGTTSQDTSPVHTYAANGIYHVCLTVCNALSCDTLCYDVVVDDIIATEMPIKVDLDGILVYPNPAFDRIYIDAHGKDMQAQILNNFGQIVVKQQAISSKGIDVGGLDSGIYRVILIFPDGTRTVKSIAIAR